MLDTDGTLKFAGATGGALEGGLLRVVLAEQRLFGVRAEIVEIVAHAEDDFLRVQNLSGIRGWTVLGAAAALHAGVGLQSHELSHILARHESEVLVAGKRRNPTELSARKEDGDRA
jgi:hypothetical protein